MSTASTRIGEKARTQSDLIFTLMYHYATDLDNLRACYEAPRGGKAAGVNDVVKEQYGEDLD